MRLWLRLTLIMAALSLVPLVITGALAVRSAREVATMRPEEAMGRQAASRATFVGSWVDGQARMLAGWGKVWDLTDRADDYRINLLRATWLAMDAAVTVALVDDTGRPVVPAQYQREGVAPGGREAGSAARADMLVARAARSVTAAGYAVGQPYLPPGGGAPVVPVSVAMGKQGLRMVAELSLRPVVEVFAESPDVAAVLVDGYGAPVVGGEHPLLGSTDLSALLDLGLDLTFDHADGSARLLQGAVWSVPHTDWKVVVLAPPSLMERAAATIRSQTLRIGLLALLVVLTTGLTIERTLTRSVQALRAHAGQVTRGAYESRNLVDRGDEIGELGLALNEMSARLERTDAELRAFHDELQARVEARTRQLEAAQAQLVRAGQLAAVGELGAGLAHELNNPLAALLGQVQLARARGGDTSPDALASIEENAQRCREVVETMVRLSSGEVEPLGADVVDMSVVLGEAIHAVRPLFDQRRVKLDVSIPDTRLPSRIGYPYALRVVRRLLEAVCAGLSDGARLAVEARAGANVELLLTADRPLGDVGARDDWRSAGLRLWTARGLLELAGGRVEERADGAWAAVFPGAA